MKWRERKPLKEDLEGSPTNNTGPEDFATYATPLFTTKRFGGMKEFVIPRSDYQNMRFGRSLGDRWLAFVKDPQLQAEVRKTYHSDENLLLTCDQTGISTIIRKRRLQSKAQASSSSGTIEGV